jgi:hypothetical protein
MTEIDKAVPLRNDLQAYFYVVFSYLNGFIPLRSFPEKGNPDSRPITNAWVTADDHVLSEALAFANAANSRKAAFYVIPGTVSNTDQASSSDVMEMQVLLIDIDEGDTESKLLEMTAAIGEPTMVVESGGVTKEGHPKLHIYWQLTEAVKGEDLQVLLSLRHKIALAFGGDTHFKSAHQPIRVAGSVYHKGGNARLVKIRSYSRMEYNLQELVESLGYLPTSNDTNLSGGSEVVNNAGTTITSLNDKLPIDEIFTNKIHEGGNGECSRFANLQRITGYWLRRYHDGLVTQEKALEEIIAYNEANVVPPWPIERLKPMVSALWKKHVQEHGEARKVDKASTKMPIVKSFSLDAFLGDTSKLPEDIIAPRVLTPGGIFVFGGAPKVGKSDFLLSLFVHMAAGKEFLGFVPPRPLKIFYFQAGIGYHYLRERLQNMQLPENLTALAKDNLYITPNSKMLLNEMGIEAVAEHIREVFPSKPDIIAVDPIRNVFDGGRSGATENENDAMMFFLQKRIELLRDKINPEAGIILAHHTKKMNRTQFDEDPFQAFSGASSLRSYYTSGALLYRPEPDSADRHLIFELRNGGEIPVKIINKQNGVWIEDNALDKRIAHKTQSRLCDRERERRIRVIVQILEAEALRKRFYLMKQFAEKFQNRKDLGGKRGIYDDCSVAATQGIIKFFDNPESYGLPLITDLRKGFGFMCTQDMQMADPITVPETGEVRECFITIQPTHYKRDGDGAKVKISMSEIRDFMEVANE